MFMLVRTAYFVKSRSLSNWAVTSSEFWAVCPEGAGNGTLPGHFFFFYMLGYLGSWIPTVDIYFSHFNEFGKLASCVFLALTPPLLDYEPV